MPLSEFSKEDQRDEIAQYKEEQREDSRKTIGDIGLGVSALLGGGGAAAGAKSIGGTKGKVLGGIGGVASGLLGTRAVQDGVIGSPDVKKENVDPDQFIQKHSYNSRESESPQRVSKQVSMDNPVLNSFEKQAMPNSLVNKVKALGRLGIQKAKKAKGVAGDKADKVFGTRSPSNIYRTSDQIRNRRLAAGSALAGSAAAGVAGNEALSGKKKEGARKCTECGGKVEKGECLECGHKVESVDKKKEKSAEQVAEYLEEIAPAKEAMRQVKNGAPVEEVTEKLAENGHISDEEAEYLNLFSEGVSKMAEEVADGVDPEVAKEAAMSKAENMKKEAMDKKALGSTIRKGLSDGLQGAKNLLSNKKFQTAAAISPAAIYAGNEVAEGARKAVDPLIEQYRYNKMKDSPGQRTTQHLQSTTPDQYFVPKEEGGSPIPEEERKNRAVRKAFEIVHENAPEITKDPTVAKSFINQNIKANRPDELMRSALNRAEDKVRSKSDRQKMRGERARRRVEGARGLADAVKGPQ